MVVYWKPRQNRTFFVYVISIYYFIEYISNYMQPFLHVGRLVIQVTNQLHVQEACACVLVEGWEGSNKGESWVSLSLYILCYLEYFTFIGNHSFTVLRGLKLNSSYGLLYSLRSRKYWAFSFFFFFTLIFVCLLNAFFHLKRNIVLHWDLMPCKSSTTLQSTQPITKVSLVPNTSRQWNINTECGYRRSVSALPDIHTTHYDT